MGVDKVNKRLQRAVHGTFSEGIYARLSHVKHAANWPNSIFAEELWKCYRIVSDLSILYRHIVPHGRRQYDWSDACAAADGFHAVATAEIHHVDDDDDDVWQAVQVAM